MVTLLKLELEKLFRSKGFYLSFCVLVGFVVLMLWGFYTYAARKTGGQAVEQFKYTYESKEYFNGLTFALYSVLFSFTLLLPIFVSMSAGSQIAGEARAGTLRMICTRPISRASLILSKFFGDSTSYVLPAGILYWTESAGRFDLRGWGQPRALSRSIACLQVGADADRIPSLNALLVANNIKVYELSPAQESLEEAFLRLTVAAAPNQRTDSQA